MMRRALLLALFLGTLSISGLADFDPEIYEEEAGLLFNVQVNPGDEIFGIEISDGTWLVNTPIFGALVVNGFINERDDATHGGLGMIFRLMPHTTVAPFIGAGLTFNVLSQDEGEDEAGEDGDPLDEDDEDDAYWAGHAEAGVRWWFFGREQFVEAFVRQTWNFDMEDRDYWIGGFGFGQNF